jgi:hypothetical protein
MGGSLTTLGYAAGRKSTIDVTDIIIWKRASIKSFSLFAQPPEMWRTAWKAIYAAHWNLERSNRSWPGLSFLRMLQKHCDIRSKADHSAESS